MDPWPKPIYLSMEVFSVFIPEKTSDGLVLTAQNYSAVFESDSEFLGVKIEA